jgi:hypothetical protein
MPITVINRYYYNKLVSDPVAGRSECESYSPSPLIRHHRPLSTRPFSHLDYHSLVFSIIIMSTPSHPISPPPGPVGTEQQSTGVRRHHTITAASRTSRATTRAPISEESQEQQAWNDEEIVDQEWGLSPGTVGEKGGSLHRQSSLPSRYNRGTHISLFNTLSPFSLPSTEPLPLTIQLMAMALAVPAVILPVQ